MGIHYFFLFLLKKHRLRYSIEPPRRGGSNEYPQSMFGAEIKKNNIRIFYLNIFIFGGKIFSIFEWACFRNVFYFTTAGVKCYAAVLKRLSVLLTSTDFIFISFGINEHIVATLENKHRLSRCAGVYAASHIALLLKSLNETESPIFVLLYVLCKAG